MRRRNCLLLCILAGAFILSGAILLFFAVKKKLSVVVGNEEYSEIAVVGCSDNIDKVDVEKLIDDNGTVSILEEEGYFIFDFNGEIILDRIEVETIGNGEVSVENTDYSGTKHYGEIEVGKRLDSVKCTDLKVSLRSESNFEISDIKIYGSSNVAEYMHTADEILFDAYDVRNPLSPYRWPIRKYVELLAEDILKDKEDDISDHEKVMYFMEYISEYKIGYTKYGGDDYLYDLIVRKIGACGDFSNLLAALCATQGIESRLLTLGNYPENDGHAVVEIKIDDSWGVYDPTYALYYTTTPENKKNPEVLSFQELREGKGRNATRIVSSESHITSEASINTWDRKFMNWQIRQEKSAHKTNYIIRCMLNFQRIW